MRMNPQWAVAGAERVLPSEEVTTYTLPKPRERVPLPFILLSTPLLVTVKQTAICINTYCVFHFKAPVHFHKNNVYNFMHRETSWCKIGSINRLSYLKRMISMWTIHLALSQFPYLVTFFLLFFSFYVTL